MTSRILLLSLSLLFAFGGMGCRTKTKKPRDANVPAAEMEANFRQRWVDRRVAEIVAGGKAAEAARSQAETEFIEKFNYIRPVTQAK